MYSYAYVRSLDYIRYLLKLCFQVKFPLSKESESAYFASVDRCWTKQTKPKNKIRINTIVILSAIQLVCISLAGCENYTTKPDVNIDPPNATMAELSGRADSNSQLIALKDIWALDMPGTKKMNVIMRGDPLVYESPEGSLVAQILLKGLEYDPQKHPIADTAFAVSGTGMEALQQAHAVLVKGQKRKTSFCKNEPISIIFFSYYFGSYVQLVEVEQRSNVLQLSYRFVYHETAEVTAHIAIIPLPQNISGLVRVDVKSPIDAGSVQLDWAEKIVCRSFTFNIK